MPHHPRILEKLAFSVVVFSALVCSVFIAYERCPDIRFAMQAERDVLTCNLGESSVCPGVDPDLLAGALTY
ncbi:hypothetical protein BCh11DRAFT_06370 [Burkholderia sp. Ch1-1]|nr:hypothetical protein BCh11DRAFT_06370 [Burkholderia sp. Ch1-1]